MQQEINTLKTSGAGDFRDESSRKRPRDETPASSDAPRDIWEAFEVSMKGREFDPAL